jgi:hypothetical protein
VCKMVPVVLPVVWSEEYIHMMPHGIDGVGVVPYVWINEVEAMVNGAVRVTPRVEIAIRTPAIADDRRASINSRIIAVSVSAVLSGTGRRNVLPAPLSTPPNTH